MFKTKMYFYISEHLNCELASTVHWYISEGTSHYFWADFSSLKRVNSNGVCWLEIESHLVNLFSLNQSTQMSHILEYTFSKIIFSDFSP